MSGHFQLTCPTVLREVHQRLADLKHSKESEAVTVVTVLARHEPFTVPSLATRLAARLPQRNITIVTADVPGPSARLQMLGRPVLEVFPYVPIALRLRTGVAALSYRDWLSFGVTADFASNPAITLLAAAIERVVSDLVTADASTVDAMP